MGLQADFFGLLKTQLQGIAGIKHVALWNNQLINENQENAFLYPAVFIEFANENFNNLTQGIQQWDSMVTLHVCFESYKDEDIDVLNLKDLVYSTIHTKQYTNFASKMLRIDEEQNFDHPNIQDYMQMYRITFKDFGVDSRATTQTSPDLDTPVIVLP